MMLWQEKHFKGEFIATQETGGVPPEVAAFIGVIGFILLASFITNILVVVVVTKEKTMHTATNILICNLAFSDMFMGAFILPQNLHDMTHTSEFHEGEVACKIVNVLPIICITCAIYTLIAQSMERYSAICIIGKAPMTINKAKWITAGTWVLALAISVPTFVEYSVYKTNKSILIPTNMTLLAVLGHRHYHEWINASTAPVPTENGTIYFGIGLACGSKEMPRELSLFNGFFLLFCAYIIPLVIIAFNYGRLIRFIVKEAGARDKEGAKSQVSKRKVKVVKMLIIVAMLFAVSWCPYFVLLILAKLTGADDSGSLSGMMNQVRLALSAFSVSYNVVLYLTYNHNFREGFRMILCCCCRTNRVGFINESNSMVAPPRSHITKDDQPRISI